MIALWSVTSPLATPPVRYNLFMWILLLVLSASAGQYNDNDDDNGMTAILLKAKIVKTAITSTVTGFK